MEGKLTEANEGNEGRTDAPSGFVVFVTFCSRIPEAYVAGARA
jgi:hypothetical protein